MLAPAPNLVVGDLAWQDGLARRYAAELVATLEARGYYDFGAGIELSHVVTPADWAASGLAAGYAVRERAHALADRTVPAWQPAPDVV